MLLHSGLITIHYVLLRSIFSAYRGFHRLVKVEYEDLPAILNLDDAIKADSYFSVRTTASWMGFALSSCSASYLGRLAKCSMR